MLSRILFSSSTANFPDELIRTLPFSLCRNASDSDDPSQLSGHTNQFGIDLAAARPILE
ncbi:hypothetical protein [Methylomonas sp. TEB]|uniref:hypothetical protein n=1 Tax=Methylomonas sp. TEB TaxID=3398229 RepID=UPI0039F46C03